MTSSTNVFEPVAIIGASSMVASRFCDLVKKDLKFVEGDVSGKNPIDITSATSTLNFFKKNDFNSVILFSAYTDVDSAEAQRGDKAGICWKINVEGVKNIAMACKKFNRKLIFISTDFVFDGLNGPYAEDAPVGKNPKLVSWYGITKIEGEKIIKKTLKDVIILRISYPYRGKFEEKEDVLKRIVKMAQKGSLYPMFADQKITPTFIDDLAPVIKLLLEEDQSGIFHVASPKVTTQYDLTKKTLSVFNFKNIKVEKGSLKSFLKIKGRTPRPINGGLKSQKISELGFTPTDWENGIKIVYNQSKGKLV